MSEFVKIIYGDSPVVVSSRTYDKMCIIGRATGDIGVVDNVKAEDLDPNNITITDLQTTDALYKSAMQFFGLNPSGTLVLAGIPTSAPNAVNLVELTEITDNVWSSGYSPVTSITTIEVYATDTSVLTSGDENTWYTVIAGAVVDLVNGVYSGVVNVTGVGSPVVAGNIDFDTYTDYTLIEGDRLRCTVTPNALSAAFSGLIDPQINFEAFAFAYDSELDGASEVTTVAKYEGTGVCVNNVGWLHDVITGVKMCNAFNASGQRCMFFFGLPEKVQPTEYVTDYLAAGTAYVVATSGQILYEELREKIGANKFVAGFVTKQVHGTTAVDPAIAALASVSKYAKRDMLTFYPEAIANDEWPNGSERTLWRNAQINSFIFIKEGGGMVWGNNQTFGQGADADINHIRCKNILAYKLSEALYTLLYTRKTKYDFAGILKIKSVIAAVLQNATGYYIDGPGTITIPIQDTLSREGSLTTGEATALATVRASKIVSGIGIGFQWKGDVEFIYISALLAE